MKKINVKELIFRYLMITLGAICYSFGFVAFIQANGIANGGLTGFLNIINYIYPIPVGIVYFIINIPLLIISIFKVNWKFTISTLIGTGLESLFITLFEMIIKTYKLTETPLISAVFGGLMLGAGLGVMMRFGSSTGGNDIIIKMLHRKKPHLSGGFLYTIIDAAILILFLIVKKNFDMFAYALIVIILENVTFDLVINGSMSSRTIYIITNNEQEVVDRLLDELEIGATMLQGKGAFTGMDKNIIMCVAKSKVFPEVKRIVKESGGKSFMIVGKSLEVYGEGYDDLHREKL